MVPHLYCDMLYLLITRTLINFKTVVICCMLHSAVSLLGRFKSKKANFLSACNFLIQSQSCFQFLSLSFVFCNILEISNTVFPYPEAFIFHFSVILAIFWCTYCLLYRIFDNFSFNFKHKIKLANRTRWRHPRDCFRCPIYCRCSP